MLYKIKIDVTDNYIEFIFKFKIYIRMHSSRMRTARSLTVSHCIRKTEKTTHTPPGIKPRMPPE